MNIAEALNTPPTRPSNCRFGKWFTTIPETDRNDIEKAFDNHTIETSHIVRVLQEYGCPMSDSSIRTHRRRECKTCGT